MGAQGLLLVKVRLLVVEVERKKEVVSMIIKVHFCSFFVEHSFVFPFTCACEITFPSKTNNSAGFVSLKIGFR